jgi:hypothetical protein
LTEAGGPPPNLRPIGAPQHRLQIALLWSFWVLDAMVAAFDLKPEKGHS